MPERIPLYARFSSDVQNPSSVEDQLARLRAYLERNGIAAADALVFSDSAISGSVWEGRPGVQALLAAVKANKVSCVHAEDLDRISRKPGDLAEFSEQLHHYGVVFLSVSDGLRLDGSVNAALSLMLKSFSAEQSVKATADKSQRGLRSNFEQKKTTGGRTYGYERVKIDESKKGTAIRENRIDAEQAGVVELIFNRYAQGLGYGAIAAELNAKKLPPPRGAQEGSETGGGWVGSAIREMLRNRKYIGDWTFGRREWARHPDTERRVVRRMRDANNPADAERLKESHFPELAIIERPLWDKVQARLDEHAERYKRREMSHQKSHYLLSGLLKCGSSGGLIMQISGGTHARYRCAANTKRGTCENSLSIRESTVREAVVDAMGDELSKPENLDVLRSRMEALMRAEQRAGLSASDVAALRKTTQETISTAEGRLKKLYLLWADAPDETLDQLMKELRAEVAAGKTKLAELDELEAGDDQKLPTADDIEEAARFVASLGFLNELDAEPFPSGSPAFDDGEDPGVRVAKMREALRLFLADGIKLTPATDAEGRFYFIDLAVLPLSAAKFQGDKRRTAQRGAEPYDNRGCAGAIRSMYHDVSLEIRLRLSA